MLEYVQTIGDQFDHNPSRNYDSQHQGNEGRGSGQSGPTSQQPLKK